KIKAYYTANGDTGMLNKRHIASYLNSQFGFSRDSVSYLNDLRKCKLVKEWVTGVTRHDDGVIKYDYDMGDGSQFKVGIGNFSIEAWVYMTDTTNNKTILSTLTDSANTYTSGYWAGFIGRQLEFSIGDGSHNAFITTTKTSNS